jgi:hypothetical protein
MPLFHAETRLVAAPTTASNAEDRAGIRRGPAEVPLAEPGRVHKLAAGHDPLRQARLPAALVVARRQGVHVSEIDHSPSLPESSGYTAQTASRAII